MINVYMILAITVIATILLIGVFYMIKRKERKNRVDPLISNINPLKTTQEGKLFFEEETIEALEARKEAYRKDMMEMRVFETNSNKLRANVDRQYKRSPKNDNPLLSDGVLGSITVDTPLSYNEERKTFPSSSGYFCSKGHSSRHSTVDSSSSDDYSSGSGSSDYSCGGGGGCD